MTDSPADRVFLGQYLSGRDFAVGDPIARQMVNFSYAIGDRSTGECVLVDPAYGVTDLVNLVAAEGLRVTGVLASHYHADHVGGSMMGHTIEGVAELLETHDIPVHVNRNEAPWILRTTGLGEDNLALHDSGDTVSVGGIEITLVHTPGHTPGSQCFLAMGCLMSGDTLFLDGCGRTDLPGSNAEDMYDSLTLLAGLPGETVVLPGHRYSESPAAALSSVKGSNYVFRPGSREQWLMTFGSG